MKPTTEAIEKFRQRYLEYSVKNVLWDMAFMSVVLSISIFYNGNITWKGVLFIIVASAGYSLGNTALQRYLHRKGKLHIPPQPKYSTKTYQEHQADREAQQKDQP